MENQIIQFVQNYPWGAIALMSVGVFRVVFKPVFTAVDKFVEATPSKSDDAFMTKVYASKAYRYLAWFADYAMSLKLPK